MKFEAAYVQVDLSALSQPRRVPVARQSSQRSCFDRLGFQTPVTVELVPDQKQQEQQLEEALHLHGSSSPAQKSGIPRVSDSECS